MFRIAHVAAAAVIAISPLVHALEIKSISALEAGPGRTVFVADWKTGGVWSVDLGPSSVQKQFERLDVRNLGSQIAKKARHPS